jgi:hypothetical protein
VSQTCLFRFHDELSSSHPQRILRVDAYS